MWPIITDVAYSVVYVSGCMFNVGHTRSPWEGAILGVLGVVRTLESIGSICCGVCSKRDDSVVSNGMQREGSFSSQTA